MGRRGPKPQPTVLKLARGNPGRRPVNANEPDHPPPPVAATKAPPDLTGFALTEWNAQIDELITKGVLTVVDMSQFRQYCWMYGEAMRLEEKLEKAKNWTDRHIKLSGHLSKLHARVTQQAAHFGITPSSRSGVQAVKSGANVIDEKRVRFFGKKKEKPA
jgi:phage terminase small subunit